MSTILTPRERQALKGRAHALEPIVQIGNGGLTDAVLAEIDRALTAHELVKVRAGGHERDDRTALLDAICAATGAAKVQQVGKVMVLWRPRPADDDR